MKLRVFYKPSNDQIVWTSTVDSDTWPYSIADYATMTPEIPPNDYACIEVTDQIIIKDYLASDENIIINGQLHIGLPRVIPPLKFEDLPRSTISATVISIAEDKLSCVVERIFGDKPYQGKALLTNTVAKDIGKPQGIQIGDTILMTYVDHAPIGTLPIIVDEIAAIVYPL